MPSLTTWIYLKISRDMRYSTHIVWQISTNQLEIKLTNNELDLKKSIDGLPYLGNMSQVWKRSYAWTYTRISNYFYLSSNMHNDIVNSTLLNSRFSHIRIYTYDNVLIN